MVSGSVQLTYKKYLLIIYLGKICITSLLAATVMNSLHSHQEWCPDDQAMALPQWLRTTNPNW